MNAAPVNPAAAGPAGAATGKRTASDSDSRKRCWPSVLSLQLSGTKVELGDAVAEAV